MSNDSSAPFKIAAAQATPVYMDRAATIDRVLREATLERPQRAEFISGGRMGRHTPHLAEMLADMQSLARAHPGAQW